MDTAFFHLATLLALYLAAWLPAIKGGFVSDDIEGLAKFSDRFDAQGDRLIETYEVTHGDQKFALGHRAFNRYVTFPGSVIRWIRLNLGAKFQIVGKNKKGHNVYGYVQDPKRHHFVNILLGAACLALGYCFLSTTFTPGLAFYACLLMAVHPLQCQAIAWCSGIGYLLSLLGALASLNLATHITDIRILVPAVAACTFLSVSGMMAGVGTFVVLFFLGYSNAAYAALVISAIALYKQGRSIVNFRSEEFKKQQMGKSTKFNWRKPIIMVKTAWYYLKLMAWPKRLGLFHTWGYHFDETLDRVDGLFWKGLVAIIGLAALFFYTPLPVQLGLLRMLVYVAIFLNFITAQQFVADRYAFIPTFGFCLVIAYFLQDYPVAIAFITGLLLMRTWTHLPTFENEVKFYQSNVWNFPDSEVAYGNLGVICANRGMPGAATDTWLQAANINPLYDVPHYNLYSMLKSSGQLEQAREFLLRCLNAKVVHFPDLWNKELQKLDSEIYMSREVRDHLGTVNRAIKEANYERK